MTHSSLAFVKRRLMFDIDEMVEEFLTEAHEHRDSIEELLLGMENCNPAELPGLVNELFRSVHSIKGAAGTVEFENICLLTHAMETELSKVREGELEVSAQLISALLCALDRLNDMLKDVEHQQDIQIADVVKALEACSQAQASPASSEQPAAISESSVEEVPEPSQPNGSQKVAPDQVDPVLVQNASEASSAPVESFKAKDEPQEDPGLGRGSKQPTETIRVPVWALDSLMALAGELVLVRNRQLQSIDSRLRHDRTSVSNTDRRLCQQLDLVTSEIQDAVLRTRMQPIGIAFQKLRRLCRDLGQKLGKEILYENHGSETEVDKTILECLGDPLMHLVRNSCDHGLGTPQDRLAVGKSAAGLIQVSAHQDGGQIVIEVQDDGRGIDVERVGKKAVENGICRPDELEGMSDKQVCMLIFSPGFSTAAQVSDISGRGVGMDVVKTSIEKIGGSVDVQSKRGEGTRFVMRVPLTLAIVSSLIVRSSGQCFAIPQVNLEEVVCLHEEEVATRIEFANNYPSFRLRGQLIPLVCLDEVLRSSSDPTEQSSSGETRLIHALPDKLTFAVVRLGAQKFGIVVDAAVGTEEIVVKPNHPMLSKVRCFVGSTVLGDGSIALIVDVNGIAQHAALDTRFCEATPEELKGEDAQEVLQQLAFTLSGDDCCLFPLSLISRVVNIHYDDLEFVGGVCTAHVDGENLRIVDIAKAMEMDVDWSGQELALILPRHINRPVAFLCRKVLDIRFIQTMPSSETHRSNLVLGSLVLEDKLALVLDMFALAQSEEPAWFQSDSGVAQVPQKPKRILLAEDTAFFRRVVGHYLTALGYDVVVVEDGELAANELLSPTHGFDILISDIQMPNLDGFGLIQRLRNDVQWKHCRKLPAMAMSSLSSPEAQSKAVELGFDWYELKLNRESLQGAVAQILEEKRDWSAAA